MFRLIPLALVLLTGPAAAQSFTLPELGLQNAGTCRQLAARDRTSNAMIALGCLDTNAKGWNLTPKVIQLQGPGSTGDVSTMSVATPRVPGGQPLSNWMTNPALAGVAAPAFGGVAPRVIFGSNPDNQSGFSDAKTKNPVTLFVDTGGYGDPTFSGFSIPESITGAINIPANATANNHASGVAGYARSASTKTGGVGIYGQGDASAANALAWGFNTRTQDNGFKTNALWGGEIDINVSAAGTFARGLDIVGGSTAQPDAASPGLNIQSPGVFNYGTASPIFWGRGILINDESAYTGIEVGSSRASASGSMPITFMYRNAGNVRGESFRVMATGTDGAIQVSAPSALFQIIGDNAGSKVSALRVNGGNVGIGGGGPVPSYPLDVYGATRFTGNVGFGGVAPTGLCSLAAALPTDGSATNAAIATAINSVRSCLIQKGLGQ